MTYRQARITLRTLSSSTRVLPAIGALWLGACASTDLEVPLNHPGHAQARAGHAAKTQALTAAYGLEGPAMSGPPGATDEHAHHDQGADAAHDHGAKAPASAGEQPAAAAVFTCPMHPEIVRKEAGSCPICGMKLVPKKDAK